MSPPIYTPDGSEVSEIVLPDGSTASEVIDPDGNVVFEAGPDIPDSAILHIDPTQSFSSGDDGMGISTVPDELGSLDLSNASGEASVVENGINGVRSMDFDRGDLYNVAFSAVSHPTTIFVVVQYQDTNEHEVFGSVTSGREHILQGHVNGDDRVYAGNALAGGSSDTDPHLFTLIFDGANSVIRRDGSQVASGDAGSSDLHGFQLGATSEFPNTETNSLIGEVLPCDTRLSGSKIDAQESRISDKYGITLA